MGLERGRLTEEDRLSFVFPPSSPILSPNPQSLIPFFKDQRMADLVPPHGGLKEPVCRTVPAEEIKDFLARAETLAESARLRRRPLDRLSARRRRAQPVDRSDGLGDLSPRAGRVGPASTTASRTPGPSPSHCPLTPNWPAASSRGKRSPWSMRPARSWPRLRSVTFIPGTSPITSAAFI